MSKDVLDWAMRVFDTPYLEDPRISEIEADRWNIFLAGQRLVAEIRRLQKERADARVIYGVQITAMGETWIDWGNGFPPDVEIVGENRSRIPTATHTAKLVDIKKIGERE